MPAPNISIIVKMSGGSLPPNSRAGDVEVYDNGRLVIYETDTDIVERQLDRQQVVDILTFARQSGFFQLPNVIHDGGNAANVPDVTISLVDQMGSTTITVTNYQRLKGEMRKEPFDLVYKKITDTAWESYTNGKAPSAEPAAAAQPSEPQQSSSSQVPNLPFSAQAAAQPSTPSVDLPSLDDLLKSSNLDFGAQPKQASNPLQNLPPLSKPTAPPSNQNMGSLPPLQTPMGTAPQQGGMSLPPLSSFAPPNQQRPGGAPAMPQQQPAQRPQAPQQAQKPAPAPVQKQPVQQPPAVVNQPAQPKQQQQPPAQVAPSPQPAPPKAQPAAAAPARQNPPKQQSEPVQQKAPTPEQNQNKPVPDNRPRPPEVPAQPREQPKQQIEPQQARQAVQSPPRQEERQPAPPRVEQPKQQEARPAPEQNRQENRPERQEQPRARKQEERVPQNRLQFKRPTVGWEHTQELIGRLEESLKGKLLVFYVAPNHEVTMDDMRYLYSHLRKGGNKKTLYVLPVIQSGEMTVVWRMATLLREFCQELVFVLPEAASVYTTLLALSGDSIMMNPLGYLSPIETPFKHALLDSDHALPLSEVLQAAQAGLTVSTAKAKTGPVEQTPAQTIHPLVVTAAQRQFTLTQMLCSNLLKLSRKGAKAEGDIPVIVEKLTTAYPSSEYPITLNEVKGLGLNVKETTEEMNDLLWELLKNYSYLTQEALSLRDNYRSVEQQAAMIESDGRRTLFYKEIHEDQKNDRILEEHNRWRELTMQLSISQNGKEHSELQWKELQITGHSDTN